MTSRLKGIWAILLLGLLFCSCEGEKAINWNSTFDSGDKIPYGTYILYQELEELFPNSRIEKVNTNFTLFLQENYYQKNQSILYLDHNIIMDSLRKKELELYIRRGNLVFLSFIGAQITKDSITTSSKDSYNIFNFKEISQPKTSKRVFLKDDLFVHKTYSLNTQITGNYFLHYPEDAEILGTVEVGEEQMPNFIKFPVGNGWYYLHAEPYVFTNIGLLNAPVSEYAEDVMSYLPNQNIYWNNWHKRQREANTPTEGGAFDFFNFAWSHNSLRYGLMILLILGILYILFNIKRRQAIVEYQPPYSNDVLDYSQSLTDIYKKNNNFKYLSGQKITYFLNEVRQHYYFSEITFNEAFARQLHYKSQVAEKECFVLTNYINQINQKGYVSHEQFMKLSQLLDDFYLKSNIYGT